MTTVQCGHCDHVWDTHFQSHCKCPKCKASQAIADMRSRYLNHAAQAKQAPVSVQVQPIPPQVNRGPLVEERVGESAPRSNAGVPVAEQYSEIAKRMKGGVKW